MGDYNIDLMKTDIHSESSSFLDTVTLTFTVSLLAFLILLPLFATYLLFSDQLESHHAQKLLLTLFLLILLMFL